VVGCGVCRKIENFVEGGREGAGRGGKHGFVPYQEPPKRMAGWLDGLVPYSGFVGLRIYGWTLLEYFMPERSCRGREMYAGSSMYLKSYAE
jgi:hypothetical protein